MGAIVILVLIGAAAGFLAKRIMEVRMSTAQTVLVGIAGALIGGFIIRYVLPAAFALIGAVIGACLLIYLIQRYKERTR